LVDTNVFLLIVIGKTEKRLIPAFKRTSTYCEEDYDRLLRVLSGFSRIFVTPNILTEVSNLLGQLTDPKRSDARAVLGVILSSLVEIYVPSASISDSIDFRRFGLTDAGIIALPSDDVLILTDDFALYGKLLANGRQVINFNHLRFRQ